jgi:hypothetical protein
MPEVKHGGCYFCGGRDEQLLKSVVRRVIHRNGREDSAAAVALCSICIKADVVDLRVAPKE